MHWLISTGLPMTTRHLLASLAIATATGLFTGTAAASTAAFGGADPEAGGWFAADSLLTAVDLPEAAWPLALTDVVVLPELDSGGVQASFGAEMPDDPRALVGTLTTFPEPASFTLLAVGLAGVLLVRARGTSAGRRSSTRHA